jgi:hypothetical protein
MLITIYKSLLKELALTLTNYRLHLAYAII